MPLLDKLLYLKNATGLTSEEISQQANVPIGTLNKILTGETKNPTAKTVSRIAKVLNVSTEYLLNDEIPIEKEQKKIISTAESLRRTDKQLELLIENYHNLNEEGQENLLDYSNFLVSSGKYKPAIKNNPLYLGKEA